MPEATDPTRGEDRIRIDASDDGDVSMWSRKFAVTPEQLKEAIAAVGDRADDVELHLKGSRATTQAEQMKDAQG